MSDDDIHNNEDSEDMSPQPQSRAPARYNWGRGMSVSSMVGVVAIVGMGALLLFGVALCSRPPAGEPLAGAEGGILERNVKAAFGNNTPEGHEGRDAPDRASPSSSDTPGQASESQPERSQWPQSGYQQQQNEQESPQEQQQRAMEEQQDTLKAQEELRDQQREQVPSILPENPPTPVPLGGNDY
ncbi:MAG TPA: hypothetical protein VFS88_00590 [Micavibrio sp.]|nr:hypothetical protein [Micavibrio sp.]